MSPLTFNVLILVRHAGYTHIRTCSHTGYRCAQDFTGVVGDLVSTPTYMKALVSAMNVILSASTLPVKVMEEFQAKYSGGVKHGDIRSDARKVSARGLIKKY